MQPTGFVSFVIALHFSSDSFYSLIPNDTLIGRFESHPAFESDSFYPFFSENSGKVIHGRSIVRLMEEAPIAGEAPAEDIVIADCGQLAEGDSGIVADEFADGHEEYPSDDEADVNDAEVVYGIAIEVKEKGTELFKKGNFEVAQKKYVKALRCTFTLSYYLQDGVLIGVLSRA